MQADEAGNFLVMQLIPGEYEISIEKTGFRRFVRSGVLLQVGQRARVDAVLTVGSVSESVEVKADAPMLETEDASLGQVIENRKVLDLPLNGRNIVGLAALSPGVVGGTGFGGGIPNGRVAITQASTANLAINGGMSAHNDVLIDGVPLAVCCQNQIAFLPSIDTTEEFRVRTSMYDAKYGRTSGGLVTFASKSGSNQWHGSLYEFLRNKVLDANTFFNNRQGIPKGHFVYNQFGARLGGRAIKDKTFFFVNFEGIENRRGQFTTGNVPTEAERNGQFSQPIYDPLTTRASGTTFIRDPFPENRIPADRLNQVGVNLLKLYPLPNATGATNFISNASALDSIRQMNYRLDHLLTQTQRLFVRASREASDGDLPNTFGTIASPGVFNQRLINWNGVVDHTLTLSPTLIINLRYGFTRQGNSRVPLSLNTKLTDFGWPTSFDLARQYPTLPQVSAQNYMSMSSNSLFNRNGDVHAGGVTATKILGPHSLSVGLDYRVYRTNWINNGTAAGSFSFNTAFTRGPNAQTGAGGNSIASLLLGYPASGSISIVQPFSSPHHYSGVFVQDDYRVNRTLTLNFGLRWDVERPRTERYNRLSYFDPNVLSPAAGVAGISDLRGGLQFVGVNGNSQQQQATDWNNLGPRFGFAWSGLPNFVIRGGYGITFVPITSRYELNSNQGFSATTQFVSSLDGGLTPAGTLSNPFPNGVNQPLGSAPGLLSSLGEGFSTMLYRSPVGYNQQWSFNVQREITSSMTMDAAYVGSKGTKLPVPLELNALPDSALALGNQLLQQVPNPFRTLVSTGALSVATVTRLQLLRPFPQFLSVNTRVDIGSSIYHGLQLRLNQRLRAGASVLASYTAGKILTDTTPYLVSFLDSAPGFQNVYNRRLDRSLAPQDVSQRLAISYVWELPFGRGKRWLDQAPALVDAVLGGWQVNGIAVFQTGQPVIVTNSVPTTSGATRPNNNGGSAKKSGDIRDRLTQYFDTSVFSGPGPFEFGNTGRTLPDVREPGTRNFDVSVFKNFRVWEGAHVQFRSEFFNVFNTVTFGAPGGSYGNPTFGTITSQANDPRDIQLALKLIF